MKTGRYQHLIKPISLIIHLCIINSILFYLTPETYLKPINILFYNLSWLIITSLLNYYPTSRIERFMTNIKKLIHLYLIYGLAYFSWFIFSNTPPGSVLKQLGIYGLICLSLITYRILFYYLTSKYRLRGGNYVNVIVIGRDKNLKRIRKVFDTPDLGYRYNGYFDDTSSKSPTYLGPVLHAFKYIIDKGIDEVYCTASSLNKAELQNFINFADNNLIKLKIILDNKDIITRAMKIQQYENTPVLNLRTVPLEIEYEKIAKRIFDIIFSSIIILSVLSWLTPLLYILIKLETPGPLFYKQQRHGLKRKPFMCYKFRSMSNNAEGNTKMATKNDARVTRIGKILRKTSIDELPQFFNVFIGDMSVVGPRPHMAKHTEAYEISVDKYLVRHLVKPGITGLAQIRGYRGEICKPRDIINRIRLDIMYVEKYSIGLDFKIIYNTVSNVFKGEEKAY